LWDAKNCFFREIKENFAFFKKSKKISRKSCIFQNFLSFFAFHKLLTSCVTLGPALVSPNSLSELSEDAIAKDCALFSPVTFLNAGKI
jgi:hypothetical protein